MDTPGNILKTERLRQKRTLKDIEIVLKLKGEYLEAIENDNYSNLPAEAYAKSYLRHYADALGLDSGYIIRLYEEQLHPAKPPYASPPKQRRLLSSYKKKLPPVLRSRKMLAAAASALLLLLILFITLKKYPGEKKLHTDTGGEQVREKTVTTSPPDEKQAGKMTLEAVAEELTWISISIDGQSPLEWLLRKGEKVSVSGTDSFEITIGNAGGTTLLFNGREIDNIGPHGKVVDVILPPQGKNNIR